jgi:hypothetical protein
MVRIYRLRLVALIEDVKFDQAAEIATTEEAADIATVQPSARLFVT